MDTVVVHAPWCNAHLDAMDALAPEDVGFCVQERRTPSGDLIEVRPAAGNDGPLVIEVPDTPEMSAAGARELAALLIGAAEMIDWARP